MTDDAAPVLSIPDPSLVVLAGSPNPTDPITSAFAARSFAPDECVPLDTDDGVRWGIVAERLNRGRLTVVQGSVERTDERVTLARLAHAHDLPAAAVVFASGHPSIAHLASSTLERWGFHPVHILRTTAEAEAAHVARVPLPPDRRADDGPFDIIGDVHGCYDELVELLALLGYQSDLAAGPRHPAGRRAIFVGDLVDRGPKVVETVALVRRMTDMGTALCLPGNHDDKLARRLKGHPVRVRYGLAESLAQIDALPAEERERWVHAYLAFYDGLPSHYVLDGGMLVVAHAGMKEAYQGRVSRRVREFALYGETTGESDEYGLPVRLNWAADYHGSAAVVCGHTVVAAPDWLNNTIDIDTGCVHGGRLTALCWPERALVSVPARRIYAPSQRPI